MPPWWQEGWGNPVSRGAKSYESIQRGERRSIKNVNIKEGEFITIDGSRGEVYLGEVPTVDPEISKDLLTLLKWADEIRTLGVRANADTSEGAVKARQLGAEGIGLCRTERMFNAADRLPRCPGDDPGRVEREESRGDCGVASHAAQRLQRNL